MRNRGGRLAAACTVMVFVVGAAPGAASSLTPGGDAVFGAAGEVVVPLDGMLGTNVNATVSGATVDRDGRLLVTVRVDDINPTAPGLPAPAVIANGLVARFLPDGSIDGSFGGSGTVVVPHASSAVQLQTHRILVVSNPPYPTLFPELARLLADDGRQADDGFDGRGFVGRLDLQADGSIVGGGPARLPLPEPPRDPTKPPTPPPTITAEVIDVVDPATGRASYVVPTPRAPVIGRTLRQRDGRFVADVNDASVGCPLYRFLPNGVSDPFFASVTLTAPSPLSSSELPVLECTVALAPDDSLVVTGAVLGGGVRTFHLGRDGQLVGFGAVPYIDTPSGARVVDVSVSGGGRVVLAGSFNGNAYVQSFFLDGAPDVRLGPTGTYQIDYGANEGYERVVTSPFGGQFAVGFSKSTAAGTPTRSLIVTKLFSWVGTAPDLGIVTESKFVPIDPVRVLDTRTGGGAPLGAGGRVDVSLLGKGGLPADATAAVLNVTATGAAAPGYVTVWPTDAPLPTVSNLNVEQRGQTVANHVTVALSGGGRVSMFTQTGTHLVADLAGFYVPVITSRAGRFVAAAEPTRLLDTRLGVGAPPAPLGRSGSIDVAIAGVTPVPIDGVSAVVLNVTATEAAGPGYVTVWPTGSVMPTASNLNLERAGQTRANLVTVKLGAGGRVSLFSQSGTHLVADVAGWYTDETASDAETGLFVPVVPNRVADTRIYPGKVPAGGTVSVGLGGTAEVPPVNAGAVAVNLTVTEAGAAGFVTAWPTGGGRPGASNLNLERAGQTVPNAAVLAISPASISVYTQWGAHVIVDVNGWFVAAPS